MAEEALDHAVWRTRFGRSYESLVRQTTEWMRVYFESELNDFVTQNIITRCAIFSNPFRLEESKFTNVFVTDLYSPAVKPLLCSAMSEVLCRASHNSLGKATPCKLEYPEESEYVRHTTGRRTLTILELKLSKRRGCLWQGTSGKLRWALLLQSWRKILYFRRFQVWLIYICHYINIQHDRQCKYNNTEARSPSHFCCRKTINIKLEGCLIVHLPHEIIWNANLMQQDNFINVFLARHVSGIYAHHQEH